MSSDSNITVPSLAHAPAKFKKKVKNAIWPVLLLQKFVYSCGSLEEICITELLLDTMSHRSSVITLPENRTNEYPPKKATNASFYRKPMDLL